VDIVMVAEIDASVFIFVFLFAALCISHWVIRVPGRSWIAEPKAHIRNRVIGLSTLQTSDRVGQAIFLNTLVEALSLHVVRADAQDIGKRSRGVHDGKSAREAIQKHSRARLVRVSDRNLGEF
jgi:hypothetical protein